MHILAHSYVYINTHVHTYNNNIIIYVAGYLYIVFSYIPIVLLYIVPLATAVMNVCINFY